ncbi:MAG: DEAD/DEAH box helicase, partial [Lysobacteraceae bacterium]
MKATAGTPRAPSDKPLAAWFKAQGWKPLAFQRELWRHYLQGQSGLLHTPTGSGKTLAAFGGPLLEALALSPSPIGRGVGVRVRRDLADPDAHDSAVPSSALRAPSPEGRRKAAPRDLKVLWITPLKALATDTVRALREPIDALGLDWQVGLRTGDASARDKRLARAGKLDVLVTTPESLSLLLSYPDTSPLFESIRCVIVDEWHELLGNKRGVLLQLSLARLRALSPGMRTWGLSATLGNVEEARDVLLPHAPGSPIVSGVPPRRLKLETLMPAEGERFPWAGHLGLSQLARVLKKLMAVRTSLVFTNTRAQAELWFQALGAVWPEDAATLALHHGSLDPKLRAAAETGLRDGSLRCVVATSSLDLGVDFPAVDQVLQVGSPKGVARLMQRAGRAKHRPGESGHVVCVPSHALELVEYAAARRAIARGAIESRPPPRMSLDVLAQHCVTCALGGGFDGAVLLKEVRGTHAFSGLDESVWQAVLDFIVQG